MLMYPLRLYIARVLNFGLSIYLHPYYVKQAAEAQVGLQGCTDLAKPWLLSNAINTKKISYAGSYGYLCELEKDTILYFYDFKPIQSHIASVYASLLIKEVCDTIIKGFLCKI